MNIEIIRKPSGKFKSALFDFDGTVSLLREGWQEVMTGYFAEVLIRHARNESENEIRSIVTEFVDRLTGKQTIFQCEALADEIKKRGGVPGDPYECKAEYLRRLMNKIKNRHEALRAGTSHPEEHLVRGSADFLRGLKNAGIKLYLASGTDEADVVAEAELLGVAKYFDGGIHGARDEIKNDAKEIVIRRIISDNKLSGAELISFGDGFVEIQLTKEAGGYAVAVATDESKREGVDEWKRARLLGAGADAVVANFERPDEIIETFIK